MFGWGLKFAAQTIGGFARAFDPASMFTPTTPGWVYNLSDFSTLYQDSAGTIPVTAAGQPVGLMLDLSGNGNHASQPTAGKRPILQESGGKYSLKFDGVDDFMSTAAIDFSGTDKLSAWVGVQANSDGFSYIWSLGDSPNTSAGAALVRGFATIGEYGTYLYGTALNYRNSTAYSAVDTSVITQALDISGVTDADEIAMQRNGAPVSYSSGGGLAGTGSLPNAPIYLASANGANVFLGNLYSSVCLGRAATADELTKTQAWVAEKTGVTL